MTYARKALVWLNDTAYYHVVARCVRRAWLWGYDKYGTAHRFNSLVSRRSMDVRFCVMKSPYPAWTAVGTTGLLSDGGIVELARDQVQLVKSAGKVALRTRGGLRPSYVASDAEVQRDAQGRHRSYSGALETGKMI